MELCKYKNLNNNLQCNITLGYCQFQTGGYEDGHICPIYHNCKDYDKYVVSTLADEKGVVNLNGSIMTHDKHGGKQTTPAKVNIIIGNKT